MVWGGWASAWGVGPAGLLFRALGKYLEPAGDRDRCGSQNPAYGGTKISGGPYSWLVGAKGHE